MEAILVSVDEAARRLSMGRSKVYDLVLRGEIASVKVGRARRVLTTGIDEYVERLRVEQSDTVNR